MRILFLSWWFPFPPDNGSKIRVYSLLLALADLHDVTLLTFTDKQGAPADVAELQALCREIEIVPLKPYEPTSLRARLGFLSLTPRSLVDTFSAEMRHLIETKLSTGIYDLVIASELGMASYGPYFQDVPALFEDVELSLFLGSYSQSTSMWSRLRNGLTWGKLYYYLRRLMRDFDAVTVVSKEEHQLLAQLATNNQIVEIVPNCIDLRSYQEFENEKIQANTLIFTGPFGYFANYDAMTWFLSDIYPKVRKKVPDVNLTITGDHRNLPLPKMKNVSLTGFVEYVHPLIAQSCISIVPLRFGGGTRIKILEAMALRTPVVTTTKGAEGLDVISGQHLLIADTPESFSQSLLQLLGNAAFRRQLADNAYQLVEEKYDWARVSPKFMDLVEKVGGTQLKDKSKTDADYSSSLP